MTTYFVSFFSQGKVFTKTAEESTARAWRAYLARQGHRAAMVNVVLGIGDAKREAVTCAKLQAEVEGVREARRIDRQRRIATGWKPYLRGRFPQFVGLLAGFPLPRERQPR